MVDKQETLKKQKNNINNQNFPPKRGQSHWSSNDVLLWKQAI